MKVRKAVIPVAGMGTRMLPATKCVPIPVTVTKSFARRRAFTDASESVVL